MILCYDVTNQGASLSLANADGGEAVMQYHAESRQFSLPDALRELFAEKKATPKDIDKIIVTLGPGSYTGIRSGLAVLEAYRLALPKIQYFGISNMAVFAWLASQKLMQERKLSASMIGVIAETRRRDFFWQCYDNEGKAINDAMVCSGGDIIGQYNKMYHNADMILVGNAVNRFQTDYQMPCLHHHMEFTAQDLLNFHFAQPEIGKNQHEPLYLKPPDTVMRKPLR